MVLNNSGTAGTYGCLSKSLSRLERDIRRRGALSVYWDSNAFTLFATPIDGRQNWRNI